MDFKAFVTKTGSFVGVEPGKIVNALVSLSVLVYPIQYTPRTSGQFKQ